MRYAIIQSGGKQYRCEVGGTIEVDRLPVEAGSKHTFADVLLVASDSAVTVGTPTVAGAQVVATALDEVKGPKVIAFRYKPKERQRKKRGHRQKYTRFKIEEIVG
jgi:large subunit ribosomal protein L21